MDATRLPIWCPRRSTLGRSELPPTCPGASGGHLVSREPLAKLFLVVAGVRQGQPASPDPSRGQRVVDGVADRQNPQVMCCST